MAWDNTLPSDTSKIRNLGTEIRPNWNAIALGDDVTATMVPSVGAAFLQQYSAQFIERNGRANANDPTTDSETLFIYCKQGAAGGAVAEAHLKDPAGNIIQITQADHLGSTATDVYLNSLAFDTSVSYNANNMVRAWALVTTGSTSFTTNKGFPDNLTGASNGVIIVDVTAMAAGGANFADGNAYAVCVTADNSNALATVTTKTATAFTIVTRDTNANNAQVNTAVNVMLVS